MSKHGMGERITRIGLQMLIAVVFITTPLRGQLTMSTEIYPYEQWRLRLIKDVDLSTKQKQQVDSIAKAYWQYLLKIDAALRLVSRDSLDRWLLAIRADQTVDLRNLLTAKQRVIFDRNHRLATRRQ
jgi:hypothetical protein